VEVMPKSKNNVHEVRTKTQGTRIKNPPVRRKDGSKLSRES
jgi:hypothetical protein